MPRVPRILLRPGRLARHPSPIPPNHMHTYVHTTVPVALPRELRAWERGGWEMALGPGIHLGSPLNLRSRLHFGKLDSWGTRRTEAWSREESLRCLFPAVFVQMGKGGVKGSPGLRRHRAELGESQSYGLPSPGGSAWVGGGCLPACLSRRRMPSPGRWAGEAAGALRADTGSRPPQQGPPGRAGLGSDGLS